MLALIVNDGRPKPESVVKITDQPRVDLFRTMTAYGGTYKFSVPPDDYGNPVYGSLLSWAHDEIVLRHEDPSVSRVNLWRFPRVGFDTARTDQKAA